MNTSAWRIGARLDGGDTPGGAWVLEHVPCGWESNLQDEDAHRTLEDVLRWAGAHEAKCSNGKVAS